MVLEYAQLMCNAHHLVGTHVDTRALYKLTHSTHPLTRWVCEGMQNYYTLHELWVRLCNEYTHRRDRVHGVERRLHPFLVVSPNYDREHLGYTNFPLCMPDRYKDPGGDPVVSYRNYYRGEKQKLFKWTRRAPPEWL